MISDMPVWISGRRSFQRVQVGERLPWGACVTISSRWFHISNEIIFGAACTQAMDAFIAATAQVHKLTLATPNQTDFETSVAAVVNPWSES
jgi:predicted nucleic acid-binding protein